MYNAQRWPVNPEPMSWEHNQITYPVFVPPIGSPDYAVTQAPWLMSYDNTLPTIPVHPGPIYQPPPVQPRPVYQPTMPVQAPIYGKRRREDIPLFDARPVRAKTNVRIANELGHGVSATVTACLADSVPWNNRCAFVQQLNSLMRDPKFAYNKDALSMATAQLIRKHMVNLNNIGNTDVRLYSEANMNLKLIDMLGHGSFGEVWRGWLSIHGASQPMVIKLMLEDKNRPQGDVALSLATDQFMNELMIQAMLHCVAMSQKLVPNPIPAVLAPVLLHDSVRDVPGIVMDNAGMTLDRYIRVARGDRLNFWAILALVAYYLRELQRAAQFQHADLHANNVMLEDMGVQRTTFIPGIPGQATPINLTSNMAVSFIDFGFACMTTGTPGSGQVIQLRAVPGNPDKFIQRCDRQSNNSDLFMLLSSIYYVMTHLNPDEQRMWGDVITVLDGFLGRALRASGYNQTPMALLGSHPHTPYKMSSNIVGTLPNDVLALCVWQLQTVPQTMPVHR